MRLKTPGIACVAVLLMVGPAAAKKKTSTPAETETPTATPLVVPTPGPLVTPYAALNLSWGVGPGQVAYRSDGRGPDAVCADDFGDLWVLDAAAHRVFHFSRQGQHIRTIALNTDAVDLAVSTGGDIFVINWQDARVHRFNRKGAFTARYEFPKDLERTGNKFVLRRFYLRGNQLRIQSDSGVEYTLGTTQTAWDEEEIRRSRQEGLSAKWSRHKYQLAPASGGGWELLEDGRKTVPLESSTLLRFIHFLDTDARGNLYLHVFYPDGIERTASEVWKVDPATGKRLWGNPLRTDSTYQPFRWFEIDPDGTLYQLMGTPQRWYLLGFKPPA